MLEMLVSSRIRRALLERILTAPQEPFYLRGLARELAVSVTPLRREIKRLERSGILVARQEANAIFYQVNTASPTFRQLHSASAGSAQDAHSPAIMPARQEAPRPAHATPAHLPATLRWVGASVAAASLVLGVLVALRAQRTPQHAPAFRLESARVEALPKEPQASVSPSTVMRGSRWQLAPIVDSGVH